MPKIIASNTLFLCLYLLLLTQSTAKPHQQLQDIRANVFTLVLRADGAGFLLQPQSFCNILIPSQKMSFVKKCKWVYKEQKRNHKAEDTHILWVLFYQHECQNQLPAMETPSFKKHTGSKRWRKTKSAAEWQKSNWKMQELCRTFLLTYMVAVGKIKKFSHVLWDNIYLQRKDKVICLYVSKRINEAKKIVKWQIIAFF